MPHQFTQQQNISEPSITNSKSTVFPRLRHRLLFNKVKASPRILISPDKGYHHPINAIADSLRHPIVMH